MTTRIDPAHVRLRYMYAYQRAHPSRPLPGLAYDRGWWRITYDDFFAWNLRTEQLEHIIARLEEKRHLEAETRKVDEEIEQALRSRK